MNDDVSVPAEMVRRMASMIGVIENFEATLKCLDCGRTFRSFYSAGLHLPACKPEWMQELHAKYGFWERV